MKIKIVKKAVKNAKPQGICQYMVDAMLMEKR